jgi:predicted dinucleotide-binding enzyme
MIDTSAQNLRIAVFGSGHMARALAPHWVGPDRELAVASRNTASAHELATELDAAVMPWREAAEWADVVLLAVHWAGVDEALTRAGADEGTLVGDVIVDCGNPVEVERFTLVTAGESLARRIQDRTRGRVVKAFNLAHHLVWERMPRYDGRPLVVPLAGDDAEAKETVSRLVADVGGNALDAGGLEQAAHLEAMAAVIIRILFGGADPTTVFNLVAAADARVS